VSFRPHRRVVCSAARYMFSAPTGSSTSSGESAKSSQKYPTTYGTMKSGQKSAKSHTPETAHLENGPNGKKKRTPRNTSANDASQVQSIQATCSSNRSTAKLSRSPTDIAPGQKMAAVAVHATTPQDDDDDAEDSSDDSVSAAAPVGMECDSSEDGVWMTHGKRSRVRRVVRAQLTCTTLTPNRAITNARHSCAHRHRHPPTRVSSRVGQQQMAARCIPVLAI
jgi:hypothetical protein